MHNALAFVFEWEISQSAKFFDVGIQSIHLQFGNRVFDAFIPMVGRGVVVGSADDAVFAPQWALIQFQAFKSLWAGDFMHQVTVYVKQNCAIVGFVNDVAVP